MYSQEHRFLLESLKSIADEISKVHALVKQASLPDRVAEVIETAVRFQLINFV